MNHCNSPDVAFALPNDTYYFWIPIRPIVGFNKRLFRSWESDNWLYSPHVAFTHLHWDSNLQLLCIWCSHLHCQVLIKYWCRLNRMNQCNSPDVAFALPNDTPIIQQLRLNLLFWIPIRPIVRFNKRLFRSWESYNWLYSVAFTHLH